MGRCRGRVARVEARAGGTGRWELGTGGSGRRPGESPGSDQLCSGLPGTAGPRTGSSTDHMETVVCTGPLLVCRNYNVKTSERTDETKPQHCPCFTMTHYKGVFTRNEL